MVGLIAKNVHWIVGKNSSGKTQLAMGILGCRLTKNGYYDNVPRKELGVRLDFEFYGNKVFAFVEGDLNIQKARTLDEEATALRKKHAEAKKKYDANYKRANTIQRWNEKLERLHKSVAYRKNLLQGRLDSLNRKTDDLYRKISTVEDGFKGEKYDYDRHYALESASYGALRVTKGLSSDAYWAWLRLELGRNEGYRKNKIELDVLERKAIRITKVIEKWDRALAQHDFKPKVSLPSPAQMDEWKKALDELDEAREAVLKVAPCKVWVRRMSHDTADFILTMRKLKEWNASVVFLEGCPFLWFKRFFGNESFSFVEREMRDAKLELPTDAKVYIESATDDIAEPKIVPFNHFSR